MNREGDTPDYEELQDSRVALNRTVEAVAEENERLKKLLGECNAVLDRVDVRLFYPEIADECDRVTTEIWKVMNNK